MPDRLPALRPDEVIRALERAGFVRKRQRAHVIMHNAATRRSVPIPVHARDLKRNLLLQIIKQAVLTRQEFMRLLRS